MSTLSKNQIAKLSSQEKKKREKLLEYKRNYHKKRRFAKLAKKAAPAIRVAMKDAHKRLDEMKSGKLDRVVILAQELRDLRMKECSITSEIKSLLQ